MLPICTIASFDVPGSAKWLKFNFKTEGFYIVTYEGEGWDALIYAINNNMEILDHEDRAGMINNLFVLSRYVCPMFVISEQCSFLGDISTAENGTYF